MDTGLIVRSCLVANSYVDEDQHIPGLGDRFGENANRRVIFGDGHRRTVGGAVVSSREERQVGKMSNADPSALADRAGALGVRHPSARRDRHVHLGIPGAVRPEGVKSGTKNVLLPSVSTTACKCVSGLCL